jgi:hypothetical protein
VWLYSLHFYFFIGVREFASLHLGGGALAKKYGFTLALRNK